MTEIRTLCSEDNLFFSPRSYAKTGNGVSCCTILLYQNQSLSNCTIQKMVDLYLTRKKKEKILKF